MSGSRFLFILVLISPLFAQDHPAPAAAHVVRATAEATVTAKPDRAQITIGVTTDSPSAKEAASQNAAQSAQLFQTLKQVLNGHGDFKTSGYSISPQYEYAPNKPPKRIAYRAENSVLVTLDDLSIVGEVIDAASNAGANNINGIVFTLKNDEAARNQAFAEAAVKARASAEAIANALNLEVAGVLEAQSVEAEGVHPVFAMRTGSVNAAVPTPIETGSLEIHETVLVTLQVR